MITISEIPPGAYLFSTKDPVETERILLELGGASLFGFSQGKAIKSPSTLTGNAFFWSPDANLYFIFDNVFDELAAGPRLRGYNEAEVDSEVCRLLEAVELSVVSSISRVISPFALSGGQQQRLLAGIIVSRRPNLILGLNPLVFVDSMVRPHIYQFVASELLKEKGVIIVAGGMEKDFPLSSYKFALMAENDKYELTERHSRPAILKQEYRSPLDGPNQPDRHEAAKTSESIQSILTLKNLTLRYPNGTIGISIDSLSFCRDRLYVVCGPNGGGKSSLIRLIVNNGKIAKGGNYFYNEMQVKNPYKQLVLKGEIAFSMQEPNLHLRSSTVGEFLEDNEVGQEQITKFRLAAYLTEDLLSAPFWVRQAVVALVTLAAEARLLIMDEPADGAAYSIFGSKLELSILSLVNEGKTIVISTHNSSLCRSLSPTYIWIEDHKAHIVEPMTRTEETYRWNVWMAESTY